MLSQTITLALTILEYLLQITYASLPGVLMVSAAVFVFRLTDRMAIMYSDKFIDKDLRQKRFQRIGDDSDAIEMLHKISTQHPKEFEYYVADIYEKLGHKVKVTGKFGSPDGGIDIIATNKKTGEKRFIQCKKYIFRDIGVSTIREVYGSLDHPLKEGDKAVVVSTANFTEAAEQFAKEKGVILINGDTLVQLVFNLAEKNGHKVGPLGQPRDLLLRNVPPACPVCRQTLVWRVNGPHNPFVGCSSFPRCKYTFSVPTAAVRKIQ